MSKPNNPRAFAEVISIDVWRTKFSDDKAIADLHIDVGFFKGRLGGDILSESPVRFELSLKRAEVHVIRDAAGVLKIPPSSVARTSAPTSKSKTTKIKEGSAKGSAGVSLKNNKPAIGIDTELSGSTQVTQKIEREEDLGNMHVSHRKDANGYVFILEPTEQVSLAGNAWNPDTPRMQVQDTKSSRKRGEPPEVTVQIRCKREDLHIENVQFKDKNWFQNALSKNKEVAVEQYLKKVIFDMGLECGDLSEPFTSIVLGDAISSVE